MTHNEIYTKFMIEYDKANVTSSYPSLTKYEAATLLDRAYLTLISRKLTGNNTRRAPFEYDTKAIEDLRPLVTTKRFGDPIKSKTVQNEYKFAMPDDLLYYIEGVANYGSEREIVLPVNHQIARKFKLTNSNLPWVNHPVSYIEGSEVYVLIDPFLHETGPNLDGTYIKKPASFVESLKEVEDKQNENPPGGNDDIPEGNIPDDANNQENDNPQENDTGENSNSVTIDVQRCYYELGDAHLLYAIHNSNNIENLYISYLAFDSSTEKWRYVKHHNSILTFNSLIGESVPVTQTDTKLLMLVEDADENIITSKLINISDSSNTGNQDNNTNNNSLQTTYFEYVDLGLPSGTKWAKWNVGATSETEKGGYYGWGDPTGTMMSQGGGYGETKMENLVGTPYPASLTESRYRYLDIAYVRSNGECHIPTPTLMKELVDNCTFVYTLNYNGIVDLNGYIVRKKNTTNSNYIFLPAIGFRSGVNINGNGEPIFPQEYKDRCFYWSADVTGNTNVYGWGIYYEFPSNEEKHLMTFYGLPIRPVKDA